MDQSTAEIEIAVYQSINELLRRRFRRQLRCVRVELEDAAHDIWLRLLPYCRQEPIRNVGGYVGQHAPTLVSGLLGKAAKHNRTHKPTEIV